MSSEVELKQQYLRQQILENNYDPDEFADYCIEMIGNVDIDYWTFEDLERVIFPIISRLLTASSPASNQLTIQHEHPSPIRNRI